MQSVWRDDDELDHLLYIGLKGILKWIRGNELGVLVQWNFLLVGKKKEQHNSGYKVSRDV